jgi:hypothetical protein
MHGTTNVKLLIPVVSCLPSRQLLRAPQICCLPQGVFHQWSVNPSMIFWLTNASELVRRHAAVCQVGNESRATRVL